MYTVGSWLMPRAGDKRLIEIMQPVSPKRSKVWTDSLQDCIEWYLSGERKHMEAAKKRILAEREAKKAARRKHQ
jgi:hypothetical protein